MMDNQGSSHPLSLEQKLTQAADFMVEYYREGRNHEPAMTSQKQRLLEVTSQLQENGYYRLTDDELVWGARTAWRNAPRCPARVIWQKLTVFDCRDVTDADGMFAAICRHLEVSLNMGNIQPAITIFRERRPGVKDVRVWNSLILSFAGYEQEDGSVVGDPAGVELTQVAEGLGWRGAGGRFDLLPWVLSGEDGEPRLFNIPQRFLHKLPLVVDIAHPTIEAIGQMGLKGFSLPGGSNMMAEIGGVQFTAAPFSGWYQETEIGSRDLLDRQRYNLLKPLGEAMGLDMSSNTTLWKDTVALELNKAVLESYRNAKVSIVDHYTQAEQFMEHMAAECRDRGGCPADWVWIVPPQSGSLVPTFHQEMLRYTLSPSYEYQEKPWLSYNRRPVKIRFRAIAWMILIFQSIYTKLIKQRKKVTILYGTETGQSKRYAKQAMDLFMASFRCNLLPLDSKNLHQEILSSDVSPS
jgi:nitric oxide synthase oxygenase domain/subunit